MDQTKSKYPESASYQTLESNLRRREPASQLRRPKQIPLFGLLFVLSIVSTSFNILYAHYTDVDLNQAVHTRSVKAAMIYFVEQKDNIIKLSNNWGIAESNPKEQQRKFFRYDEAGPKPIAGTARSHALPNAVPVTNIIPREYAENKEYHISQRKNSTLPHSFIKPFPTSKAGKKLKQKHPELYRDLGNYNWNHTYHDDYRTLYLYNPSILPLHQTVRREQQDSDKDPDWLSATDLQELTGGDLRVRYVAVFRAYLGCNCFGRKNGDRTLMTAGEQISYMAIALLDESLDVIEGTDVLIDLNAFYGEGIRGYFRQFAEDCRISLLKGTINLICNSQMKRIRIKRKKFSGEVKQKQESNYPPQTPPPGYGTKEGMAFPYIFPNIHGHGLEVTLLSHNVNIHGGKNMNVFRAPVEPDFGVVNEKPTEYDYYLQTWPVPHKYEKLIVPDGGHENDSKVPKRARRSEEHAVTPLENLPQPTFDTPDVAHNITRCDDENNKKAMNCTDPVVNTFWENGKDHGNACCVKMLLPYRDVNERNTTIEVMVGISHKKTSQRSNFWLLDIHKRYENVGHDQFVSRFVAYDAKPPFDIVARSGWFCLGFADEGESVGPFGNTLAGKNKRANLDLFDEHFNCPVIHFVSGFAEAVGNSSRAIIGYGINDCHPRMYFVEKDDIFQLLTQ